jgi:hypothetical protein
MTNGATFTPRGSWSSHGTNPSSSVFQDSTGSKRAWVVERPDGRWLGDLISPPLGTNVQQKDLDSEPLARQWCEGMLK